MDDTDGGIGGPVCGARVKTFKQPRESVARRPKAAAVGVHIHAGVEPTHGGVMQQSRPIFEQAFFVAEVIRSTIFGPNTCSPCIRHIYAVSTL